MKQINTTEAVGQVLCHDITQIIKGVTKDARFRKGHIVTEEDIPVLLSLGKDHLYVWENDENTYHENEAAEIDGLFRIDMDRLDEINDIDQVMIASRHNNSMVKAGDTPLCSLHPYQIKKAGIVTTGNEVFYGRIKDTFTPVVVNKLKRFGIEVTEHIIVNDDKAKITEAILELKEKGCELIVTTGGMSVDPDDQTPGAIKGTGADVVSYGAPVLPRVAAKVPVTRRDLTRMGNGGLCLGCEVCHYPNCGFGKG